MTNQEEDDDLDDELEKQWELQVQIHRKCKMKEKLKLDVKILPFSVDYIVEAQDRANRLGIISTISRKGDFNGINLQMWFERIYSSGDTGFFRKKKEEKSL